MNHINIKIFYEDIYIKDLSASRVDLSLKNSNLVIDPIMSDNIKKTIIDAIDTKIVLKEKKNVSPLYIFDLKYGNITGEIDKELHIIKNNHNQQAKSIKGSPEIIIKGDYTDVKIVKK